MKIAFVQTGKAFSAELFREISGRLHQHELLLWEDGKQAPAMDLEMVLVTGKFTREQISGQPKLLLIQTVSAGYDGIDTSAASELGIWVSYAPSELTGNAISVAEFAVMLLLGAAKHLSQLQLTSRHPAGQAPGITPALYGKTVCIVGLGTIGRLLVERLAPFGMQIRATDDHPKQIPEGVTVFPTAQLNEALSGADYVVLCVRATKENENLIGTGALKVMKRGAVLINISRGTLIDEAALFDSLTSGHIAAAGLDVLRKEPADPGNPLLTLPQVLITPHSAGSTDLTLKGMADYALRVISGFSSGKKLESLVNHPEKPRYPFKG